MSVLSVFNSRKLEAFDCNKAVLQGIQIDTIFRTKLDTQLGVIGLALVGHSVEVINDMVMSFKKAKIYTCYFL